jgi:hypothetical protein
VSPPGFLRPLISVAFACSSPWVIPSESAAADDEGPLRRFLPSPLPGTANRPIGSVAFTLSRIAPNESNLLPHPNYFGDLSDITLIT